MSDDLTALETELDEAQAALTQLHDAGTSPSRPCWPRRRPARRPPRLTWRRPSQYPEVGI